jgi:hypothetical protein
VAGPNDFNAGIIEEFRANDGKVGGGFAGAPMLLLHSTGAKSGQERVNPMVYPERERIWAKQKQAMPGFADYEQRTSRVIPVVILERRGRAS